MDPSYQWFQNNLDYIFFVYGLAFLILGMAVLLQAKKESDFNLARILWLFASYCLIHSISDFIHMWLFTKGTFDLIHYFAQFLSYLSFIFLFEFGRRLLGLTNKNVDWRILPIIYFIIFSISLLFNNFWVTIDILIGYFVRVPGGIMAGVGFFLYYNFEKKNLIQLNVKKYFYIAGAALLAWSFFCGMVRTKGDFFPANILNIESFFLAVNIPVYIFRSIFALIVTWALIGILKIFNWEAKERLKKAKRKLEDQNLELEKLNELKSEFLRRASHELKTPLISIKGFSDLILSSYTDQLDPVIISNLREINDGCERLQNIINNLLKTSRLESPDLEPKLKNEDLSFLIKFCVHELQTLAKRRNQSIKLEIQDEIYVNMEKEEIHDVLSNLLINAIKYTPPMGKIEIKTELQDNSVVVSVIDNGIGFTNEQKNRIFQQFGKIERYGQGLDLGIDGTGLGLYISKRIVELHGGKVWMESEGKNKGASFYFTLPTVK
ncbi:MAG: Signal transduction histidine kinase [Candidatus Lokiarchaeum sp. GC14_75]|nr:MAG: Signal transduction histidine kinase [Candidatus Lokiarchaeum sp. GC14_75]